MNILIIGINGKMGKMLNSVANDNNCKIVAGIDKNAKNYDKNTKIYENFEKIPEIITKKVDIVIDFALPDIINSELNYCIKNNKKLIICSTGHTEKQLQDIKIASKKIPIFKTANTSVGIALIQKILKDNLNIINDYRIEIIEKHHKNKKDKPSGTAKEMLNILNNQPNCYSIRAGSIVGEHEILLFGESEQISIKHIAESRTLFAIGAIKIAKFMHKQNLAKLYDMNDLLKNFSL